MHEKMSINTAFLLMAQYGGIAVVPIEWVCRDYFRHLEPAVLTRKCAQGDIALPLVRMESSQKAARGVHIQDLADYLDGRRAAAVKELGQITGRI